MLFDLFLPPVDQSQISSSSQLAQLTAQQTAPPKSFDMVLASCTGLRTSSEKNVGDSPGGTVRLYLQKKAGKRVDIDFSKAKITVLVPPKHGAVKATPDMDQEFGQGYFYTVNPGYIGDDSIIYGVEIDGKRYKVNSLIRVMEQFGEESTFCAGSTFYIKRVGSLDGLGGDLQNWRKLGAVLNDLAYASNVTYSFSDLPGTAVGTTAGEGPTAPITLDTTTAGHDCYIDSTPLDNTDDYLPTSNPNEWVAKAGSGASLTSAIGLSRADALLRAAPSSCE